jgi:hypothetical protein
MYAQNLVLVAFSAMLAFGGAFRTVRLSRGLLSRLNPVYMSSVPGGAVENVMNPELYTEKAC